MAGARGLEPPAFCVTGRRYNQLNYAPECAFLKLLDYRDACLRGQEGKSKKWAAKAN